MKDYKNEQELLKEIFGESPHISIDPTENEKEVIGMKFEVCWCETCTGIYVKCPKCGNNTCNGGYGEDGKCPICPSAYELMYALDKAVEGKLPKYKVPMYSKEAEDKWEKTEKLS